MSPRPARALRGRAGDDPATALRDHLIDTAERLLAGRPVTTITTRDIARAAGVSDGVLYNYFSGKNDLLLAALVRRFARIIGPFGAVLPQPGTATVVDNLVGYATAALDLLAEGLSLAAGLLSEPNLLHAFLAAIHTEPYGAHLIQGPVVEYLRGEQRLGRIRPVDPAAVFALLFGAALVASVPTLLHRGQRAEVVARLRPAVETVVNGLLP